MSGQFGSRWRSRCRTGGSPCSAPGGGRPERTCARWSACTRASTCRSLLWLGDRVRHVQRFPLDHVRCRDELRESRDVAVRPSVDAGRFASTLCSQPHPVPNGLRAAAARPVTRSDGPDPMSMAKFKSPLVAIKCLHPSDVFQSFVGQARPLLARLLRAEGLALCFDGPSYRQRQRPGRGATPSTHPRSVSCRTDPPAARRDGRDHDFGAGVAFLTPPCANRR